MITLKYPENDITVSLQTSVQKEFACCGRDYLTGKLSLETFRHQFSAWIDTSRPAKVVFRWESDCEYLSTIEISKNEDFSDIFLAEKAKKAFDAYNFEAGKTYYWRVITPNETSEVFTFHTKEAFPRFIYVDGTSNVRDIGGYVTEEGKRIKQGLVYRGAELDMHILLTSCGLKTLKETLKIKSDLDLRGEAVGVVTESVIGNDVNYFLMPIGAYEWIVDEENKEKIRKVFEVFGDKKNYPVYFHCWGGADRTGCLALLLEALLGLDEENLLKDYEFTTLSGHGGVRTRDDESFKKMFEALRNYGESWKERAEKFLKSCGVTDEIINKIREIMLEDA